MSINTKPDKKPKKFLMSLKTDKYDGALILAKIGPQKHKELANDVNKSLTNRKDENL